MATAIEINEIVKLYVGYYNRAPDPAGLNFWIDAFDNGFSLDDMAVDFSTQAETLQNYPFFLNANPSVEDLATFVDSIYMNLFNRAPDEAGREFWSNAIESGDFSVGEAISLIIAGATTAPDSVVVANKVDVGVNFYIKANAQPEYTFDADDIAAATAIQASVSEDPETVTAAQAQTDSYISGLNASVINLSASTDSPGGGGFGVDTQGSAGDDIYIATVQAEVFTGSDVGTLQSSDSLAAGAGTDTLDVRVVSNFGQLSALAPAATDLEKVEVTDVSVSGEQFNIDFTNITGTTEVTAKNSDADKGVGFTSLDEGTVVRLVNYDGFVGTNFDGDRSASMDDAFDLYIENSGSAAQSAVVRIGNDDLTDDTTFEIFNIEVGGTDESFLDIDGTVVDTINVTGSGSFTLEDTFTSFGTVKTIDASALADGGLTVDVQATGTDPNFAFTGSDQNDTLTMTNSAISNSATLSLNGGEGTDTLILESFDGLSEGSLNASTGFEVLRATGNTSTLEAGEQTAFDTFVFGAQNDSRLTINGASTGDTFVFETDAEGTVDDMIRIDGAVGDQAIKIELVANDAVDGEVRLTTTTNSDSFEDIIDVNDANIASVEIVSSGSNVNANVIQTTNDGTGFANAISNFAGPTEFMITGNQALTIGAEAGVDLDRSSNTAGFQQGSNIDGSAATGDLRIAGSNEDDMIVGGSGDDVFYSLVGDDILIGNEGADQFRLSNGSGTDTIQDFTVGQDKIGIMLGTLIDTRATVVGTEVTASDYVENRDTVNDIDNTDSNKIVEIQQGATTSQIADVTGLSATEAFLLVFNETSGQGELWFDADWSDVAGRDVVAEFTNVTDVTELVGFSNTDFVEFLF